MTDQLDQLLRMTDTKQRQKCEQLYSDWEEHVFNPIANSIADQLSQKV